MCIASLLAYTVHQKKPCNWATLTHQLELSENIANIANNIIIQHHNNSHAVQINTLSILHLKLTHPKLVKRQEAWLQACPASCQEQYSLPISYPEAGKLQEARRVSVYTSGYFSILYSKSLHNWVLYSPIKLMHSLLVYTHRAHNTISPCPLFCKVAEPWKMVHSHCLFIRAIFLKQRLYILHKFLRFSNSNTYIPSPTSEHNGGSVAIIIMLTFTTPWACTGNPRQILRSGVPLLLEFCYLNTRYLAHEQLQGLRGRFLLRAHRPAQP